MHKILSRVVTLFLISTLLIVARSPIFTDVKAYSGLYLSGYVPIIDKPEVNGNIQSSEWQYAGKATFGPFTATNDSEIINGTLYMLNSGSNLYIAVKIDGDDALTNDDGFQITFDNDHGNETAVEVGDDSLEMWGSYFYDGFVNASLWLQSDQTDGGSNDGLASAGRQVDENHFEMRHPLNDSDDAHDFSLEEGDTVGFVLVIMVDGYMYSLPFSDNLGIWSNPSTYAEYIVGGRPTLSAYAATTPTIDGVKGSGEWSSADSADFVTNDGDARGTVYVMNDDNHLFILIEIGPDNDTDTRDEVRIDFDNDNSGGSWALGDDILEIYDTGFVDAFYNSSVEYDETWFGGTSDGEGSGTQDGSNIWYFECSHPLNTTDDLHDFSLSAGDIVGFNIMYTDFDSGGGFWDSWPAFPLGDADNYAHIRIAEGTGISLFGSEIIDAPEDTVCCIYPNYEGSKPPGVYYASLSDWTAIGFIIGMFSNSQNETTDTDPAVINTGTGMIILANGKFLLFGGPLVNAAGYYYENNRVAPVYWGPVGSTYYLYLADGTRLDATGMPYSQIAGGANDMFLIERFTDSSGNTIYYMYGYGWKGTFAAGKFFKFVMAPDMASYGGSFYVFRWTDDNSDGFVDLGEIDTTPVVQG